MCHRLLVITKARVSAEGDNRLRHSVIVLFGSRRARLKNAWNSYRHWPPGGLSGTASRVANACLLPGNRHLNAVLIHGSIFRGVESFGQVSLQV